MYIVQTIWGINKNKQSLISWTLRLNKGQGVSRVLEKREKKEEGGGGSLSLSVVEEEGKGQPVGA